MSTSLPLLRNPFRRLRPGCYLTHFTPDRPYQGPDVPPEDASRGIFDYLGTLRVVHYENAVDSLKALEAAKTPKGEFFRLSGDLYAFPPDERFPSLKEIPILPRDDYRFHLRAMEIRPWTSGGFDVVLESRELRLDERAWAPSSDIVLRLAWVPAPDPALSPYDHLEGEVWQGDQRRLGRITATWVSNYLRRALVELDVLGGLKSPKEAVVPASKKRGARTVTWQNAFDPAGWQITVESSDQPAISSSRVWAEFELQQALPALRDSSDTDHEWRYHVFCVGRLEDQGRGYQFDTRGTDGTKNFFESIVLAAGFDFPNDSEWGDLQNLSLQQTPFYFRVAVHEVGHAMKLEHNDDTCGFMATTDTIRQVATSKSKEEPRLLEAVEWSFAPRDLERLRHWPDIVVRPGGTIPTVPLPGIDRPGADLFEDPDFGVVRPDRLFLEVSPLLEEFPLGAPVRLNLRLHNRGTTDQPVPQLRLKSGNLNGWVKRGDWVSSFLPMARSIDDRRLTSLSPGQTLTGSMCLLRGPDGPLFGVPGPSTITVRLEWYDQKVRYLVSGSCEVQVANFSDAPHLKVARKLIETQDTLAGFAIGGDGFADGNQAINLALANPTLQPHFAVIRFRRMIRDSASQAGNLRGLLHLLCRFPVDEPFFLTGSEVGRFVDLLKAAESRNEGVLSVEKMQIALLVILGRMSDATYQRLSETVGGMVAAKAASRPRPVMDSIRKLLEPRPPTAVVDAQSTTAPASPSAKPDHVAARSSADAKVAFASALPDAPPPEAPLDRNEFWKLGLKPVYLRNLRNLLRDSEIGADSIATAMKVVVRALHRHSPARLLKSPLDTHAALVGNFLANLAIADFELSDEFLTVALAPFDDLSDMDKLIAFARQGSSGHSLDPQVINAIESLSNESNLSFANMICETVDAGPYHQEQGIDSQKIKETLAALKQQIVALINP